LPLVVSPTVRNAVLEGARMDEQEQQALENAGPIPGADKREEGKPFQFSAKQILPVAISFAFYLATSFVIVFFNTALVCCALMRFNGGNPTLGDGLNAAMARLPQILGWVLLTATWNHPQATEERVPLIGKVAVSLIGMAWRSRPSWWCHLAAETGAIRGRRCRPACCRLGANRWSAGVAQRAIRLHAAGHPDRPRFHCAHNTVAAVAVGVVAVPCHSAGVTFTCSRYSWPPCINMRPEGQRPPGFRKT
jgi:hypothetical protein